ncbi:MULTISPECIES: hypothetical protein [Tsukamurella]|uniref:Uncharacterized protein n=2 Tax=Tsukamurella TaxID=2060 RepID=A0A5C5RNQ2_9ACTN|nr:MULTISPECIES: hypothetical protein [Tsukamurella]NMD58312.1 hypothetical protein [Tsukamurella columbiensis]TWS24646.1 hypothetical protein FK530_23490 [Tsukamurella conjunctivitidis]
MSEITHAVQSRWTGELAPQQIAAEAQRWEREAIAAEEAIVAEMLRRWEQENPDRAPDEAPITMFEQQARPMSIEKTLAQVWDGYQAPEDGPDQLSELQELRINESIRRATPAMSRWMSDRATQPSRETEQKVAQLWPTEPVAVIVALELLLQARIEDELPVPATPTDPLATQLLQEVTQALAQRDARLAAARAANAQSKLS